MLKRIICTITAFCAIVMSIGTMPAADVFAAEDAKGNAETEKVDDVRPPSEVLSDFEPILNVDYESGDSSLGVADYFDETVGSVGILRNDQNGTYSSTNTNGSSWLFKNFNNPIEDGQYLMSFDLNRSAKEGLFYLRFTVSESNERSLSNLSNSFFCDGSKIGYYTSTKGWGQSGTAWETDKWNHVNLWIDTKAGMVTYVVNDKVIGSAGMDKKLYGIWFVIQSDDGITLNNLDNISMYKVTPDLAKKFSDSGRYVPKELTYAVDTDISSEYTGNIFTSFDNAKIKLTDVNKMPEPMSYTAVYSVENYRGDEVWRSEPEKVTIGANETSVREISPMVDKYDVYTFKTEYTPDNKNYGVMTNDAEFSIVNAPTPGYKNYNLGMCIHISKGVTKWDKIKYAVDTLGIGWLRDDYGWGSFEPSKGVYSVGKTMDTFFTEASQMGVKLNINTYFQNGAYGMPWSGALTSMNEEQAAAGEKAFEWFAQYTKGRIASYEIGNELNFERIFDDIDYFFKKHADGQRIAYNAIKKVNPDALVATNGLSRSANVWVQNFIDAGAKGYFDTVAIHPYQGQSTPESTMWRQMVQPMRDTLDQNGLQDVQVWTTEGNNPGHYSYFSPKQHGLNAVRQFAMVDAYNTQDVYFMYQIQTNELDDGDGESWFGVLHGQNVKNAYGAKPEYLMVANYIAQTENVEFVNDNNDINDLGDGTYALRFKKPDGSYVAMMYANNDMDIDTFDLGATSVTISDAYGNEKKVSSDNGKYTFVLGDEPIYVSYSGDKFDRCDDDFGVSTALNEVYEGDSSVYEFAASDDADIKVELPDNLSYTTEVKDGKAKVTVKVDKNPVPADLARADYQKTENRVGVEYTALYQNYGTVAYRDYVRVTVKDGNNTKYYPFGIEYLKHSADIEATIIPYSSSNTKYWKMKIKVKNNLSDKTIKGKLNATAPELFAEKAKEVKVEVAPGGEEIYYLNIPSSITKWGYHPYTGKLTCDDGEEISFAVGTPSRTYGYSGTVGQVNLKPLKHTKGDTKIDGVIDESEWKDYHILNFDKSQVSYGSQGAVIDGVVEGSSFGQDADYGGKADFSGSIYAKWDNKYLYTAAIVYDDVHWQKQDFIRYYYEDEFYLNVVPSLTQRHDTKLEFALSDIDGGEAKIYRNYTPVKGVTAFGLVNQSEEGSQLAVIRKDNVTIYEVRVEWKEIAEEKTIDDRNINIRFGLRDYDGDRDKSYSDGGWWSLID